MAAVAAMAAAVAAAAADFSTREFCAGKNQLKTLIFRSFLPLNWSVTLIDLAKVPRQIS